MNQIKLDELIKKFQEDNPEYISFCDGLDEITYKGYTNLIGEVTVGEHVYWENFVKWLKETKDLILDPIVCYNIWTKHSNDWDSGYLVTDDYETTYKYIISTLKGVR